MQNFFVDLHIHIGRSSEGRPVKITAARDLTFANIVKECVERKGIQVIGIVDCASPAVIEDIDRLVQAGQMVELADGGLSYRDKVTVILGSEVETPAGQGTAHSLCYFPRLEQLKAFSGIMTRYIKNLNLSSQRAGLDLQGLWEIVDSLQGILIPAHAFTPHKGVYGNCVASLSEVLKHRAVDAIPAIELGLSADTDFADMFSELTGKSFVTNSDAHSLPKIGREYNILSMSEASFAELLKALRREEGRKVVGNYGLHPRLGKYHRTHCLDCDAIVQVPPPALACPICGSTKVVLGVLDRIFQVRDREQPVHPDHRPPYYYQVPLQFLPKVGAKTIDKLIERFGSEMEVLHFAPAEELAGIAGKAVSGVIVAAREGRLNLVDGGGGTYGRVIEGQ
ncbi:MAG: endonuclease Q family protein [Clostridia bacterium]|nr:endonuclease Q family protein [Clostridia bacterium]